MCVCVCLSVCLCVWNTAKRNIVEIDGILRMPCEGTTFLCSG